MLSWVWVASELLRGSYRFAWNLPLVIKLNSPFLLWGFASQTIPVQQESNCISVPVGALCCPQVERHTVQSSSAQSLSCVRLFATPWTAACQASLSITNSQSLLRLMCIAPVMPSNHLILCCLLLLLPSIFPSIRVFSNKSVLCITWPKYRSFSFSISPSNEYSGLVFFRMDWLDLLAIQGTLKSLLQHHTSKASILQRSAFFIGGAQT